jgi:hypothetical protein
LVASRSEIDWPKSVVNDNVLSTKRAVEDCANAWAALWRKTYEENKMLDQKVVRGLRSLRLFATFLGVEAGVAMAQLPPINLTPLTAEQRAVYSVIFKEQRDLAVIGEMTSLLQLDPEDLACAKALALDDEPRAVHRLKPSDLPDGFTLSSRVWVPGGGRPSPRRVSEIRFSKDHLFAVVRYGVSCAPMCGWGRTVWLERSSNGAWPRSKRFAHCGGQKVS